MVLALLHKNEWIKTAENLDFGVIHFKLCVKSKSNMRPPLQVEINQYLVATLV